MLEDEDVPDKQPNTMEVQLRIEGTKVREKDLSVVGLKFANTLDPNDIGFKEVAYTASHTTLQPGLAATQSSEKFSSGLPVLKKRDRQTTVAADLAREFLNSSLSRVVATEQPVQLSAPKDLSSKQVTK